jgi:hypothetical protein
MSTTSRLSRLMWFAGAPVSAAILATAGVVAASALAGSTATPSDDSTPAPIVAYDEHQGNPVTYAAGQSTSRPPLASDAAVTQVMEGLSGEPQLVALATKSTPSGIEVSVSLTHNDDRVRDVWLADVAVGAVSELLHSDQLVANDFITSATAVGTGEGGTATTTQLGVGAVRLGQVFGSPDDSILATRIADVAKAHGLEVGQARILHPLEAALDITFVVPEGATIDWTIDELRTELAGQSPDVEALFIELDDADGKPLLQAGVAYRTGEGGLWFAPGQDERFGALHGGLLRPVAE